MAILEALETAGPLDAADEPDALVKRYFAMLEPTADEGALLCHDRDETFRRWYPTIDDRAPSLDQEPAAIAA